MMTWLMAFHNLVRIHFDCFYVGMPVKIPTHYGNDVRRAHIMEYEDFCKNVVDADGLIELWKD